MSIELARHAEAAGCELRGRAGADERRRSTRRALVDYFVRIASAVTLPVMIQDAPAYLGVRLGAGVVRADRARRRRTSGS